MKLLRGLVKVLAASMAPELELYTREGLLQLVGVGQIMHGVDRSRLE
jgi:hypothetical protein